ncbi:hypothetical protein R6V09_17975 [Streptomyces sp. W16]|uniref:hypothetical protein n=1 Tax=Streptomyces sp. W16 TaxID=3076631 RepID=UPI00295B6CE0|nr:hypothetical protein [Streptomyces sp. W16]MDV9171994.1 hypothetical protein [Streptomyces sp. W16]
MRAYFHELALMMERDWGETRQMTTGWLCGYGVPHHRSRLAGELRDWLRDWFQEPPGDGFAEGLPDPALATDVLYDVFQGALLRWLPREELAQGEFSTEADAAIGLVLAGMAGEAAGRMRSRPAS